MTVREAAKLKPSRTLISHRDVAPLFGVSVRTWRRWVAAGVVPLPHQQLGTMLLYDRAVVLHRLDTGLWPAGVTFRAKAAPGGRNGSSVGATPPG